MDFKSEKQGKQDNSEVKRSVNSVLSALSCSLLPLSLLFPFKPTFPPISILTTHHHQAVGLWRASHKDIFLGCLPQILHSA